MLPAPGPLPFIVSKLPSNWNTILLPPPMSSEPFKPQRLVPQLPLSARQRLVLPPFALGRPFMYSMPASRRPYSVTLL
ncbi:Uncharacterised protein [Burkholderia pseudomallei]|nr:Uncharacterised protein [Burkholderia pseudomallei]